AAAHPFGLFLVVTATLILAMLALVRVGALARALGAACSGGATSRARPRVPGCQRRGRMVGIGDERGHPVTRAGQPLDLDEHRRFATRVRRPDGLRIRPGLELQVALRGGLTGLVV